MRLRILGLALLATLALTATATASAQPQQWSITPQAQVGQFRPDTPYTLSIPSPGAGVVGYGHRTLGVDLRWGGAGSWEFKRPNSRDHRSIGRDERVALYNTAAHAYLGYAHETWGINLVWWPTPSYEWQVDELQDTQGNVRDELYTICAHGYLVYHEQAYGINLGFEPGPAPGLR
jgi:hypothetical protein